MQLQARATLSTRPLGLQQPSRRVLLPPVRFVKRDDNNATTTTAATTAARRRDDDDHHHHRHDFFFRRHFREEEEPTSIAAADDDADASAASPAAAAPGGGGPGALVQRLKAAMRGSPFGLADVGVPSVGALAALALPDDLTGAGWRGVAAGVGAGLAARLVQVAALEQKVPYTWRPHTLLLPTWAELLLGQVSFAQVLQQPQFRGKALPADHPDSKLVASIAERIIGAVEAKRGGGWQKHVDRFEWETVVLDTPDQVNAFVLPGGKIVVFTGILDLLKRDKDMVATVLGHEAAHALARHSAEKITLGLFIALAVQLAAYSVRRALRPGAPYYDDAYGYGRGGGYGGGYGRGGGYGGRYDQYGRPLPPPPQQQRPYGGGGGFYPPQRSRNPYANPYDSPWHQRRRQVVVTPGGRPVYVVGPEEEGEEEGGRGRRAVVRDAFGRTMDEAYGQWGGGAPPSPYGAAAAAAVGGPGGRGGGGAGSFVSVATNLLFQLPFSRRAEAEADLIGLHLMAQAGFDPRKAPATFERLEEYQARMMGKAAAGASFLQDHPRSASRVRLLQQELEQLLAARGDDAAHDRVLIRLPYFML